MLEKIHDHLVHELGQSTRTDTIFVVSAIVFNLVILGVNTGMASGGRPGYRDPADDLILGVFIVITLAINALALTAILLGRRTRSQLLQGLIDMYNDTDVARYYNPDLLANYGTRYLLFAGVIALLGITAIVIPLITRLL
ncbi:MAG: hypothetical protein PVI04_10610 [Anaerolineales bacterium]|jgi:hypothetical protein